MAQTPSVSEPSKSLSLPIGAASPLWLAFAGAASAGVAFWWMTRWTRAVRAEPEAAKLEPPVVEPLIIEAPAEIVATAEPVAEMIAATPAPVLETVAEAIEPAAPTETIRSETVAAVAPKAAAPKPAAPKAAKPKAVEAKAPAVVLAKPKTIAKAAPAPTTAPAKAKPAARKATAKSPATRN